MQWKKLGQIYHSHSIHPKLQSHAANPLPVFLKDDIYRVFFSGRDKDNYSSVGFVDIDILRQEIMMICKEPVFEYGPPESFYSQGVSIGTCYQVEGKRYILFMGWKNPPLGHWFGTVGRLVLEEDYSLSLESPHPFLDLDDRDPISISYPWVIPEKDGFRMWYGSTKTWDAGNGEMLHVFHHAFSLDGSRWEREGQCVPHKMGVAQAFCRPCVMKDSSHLYHMWFSYRGAGNRYRIGYAQSQDGQQWDLQLGKVGINVSESGWDSEMIEYPFVFDHKGARYMLYNGNGYGKTGFGLAVLEKE
jgi:hypothetical protein